MTEQQLAEIEARAKSTSVYGIGRLVVHDLPALIAEVRRLRAEVWVRDRSVHYWESEIERLRAELRR